jgi:hypothetical protein
MMATLNASSVDVWFADFVAALADGSTRRLSAETALLPFRPRRLERAAIPTG